MIPHSRIPFIYVDFDNSKAINPNSSQPYNVLLIGQKLTGSPGPALSPVEIESEKEASDLFGAGSMLHLMSKAYFLNSLSTKTFALVLDDPDKGIAAKWSITLDQEKAPDNLTLSLFIAGQRVEVVAEKDKPAADILTVLRDRINSDEALPVKAEIQIDKPEKESAKAAAVKVPTLYLICKHAGAQAGNIDVRSAYGPYKDSLKMKLVVSSPTPGAGGIDLSAALNAINERQFHLIVNPYLDKENIKLMAQNLEQRFSVDKQIEGHMIGTLKGSKTTLFDANSVKFTSKHMTILASGIESPTPDYVWAAALTGVIAEHSDDPARPFNTLPIYGCTPDEDGKRFERLGRSQILQGGFSTYNVDFSGTPRVERLITTYKNDKAPADESYLSINTLLTLSRLRYSFVNYFSAKYPRHKLASDGAVVTPGSAIITPNTARCEMIALFKSWEEQGLVEGFEQFKSELYVERNKQDPGQLDFFMSPRLVSQLNIIGANISFLI